MRAFFVAVLSVFLCLSLVLLSLAGSIHILLSDSYVLKTFDELVVYDRIVPLATGLVRESMPKELADIDISVLLSHLEVKPFIEKNIREVIPKIIGYVKGKEERLTVWLNIAPLKFKIQELLFDRKVFKDILAIVAPDELKRFEALNEGQKEIFQREMAARLLAEIDIPDRLELTEHMDSDTLKSLELLRMRVRQFYRIFYILLTLTAILLILIIVAGRIQSPWGLGGAMLAAGLAVTAACGWARDFLLKSLYSQNLESNMLSFIEELFGKILSLPRAFSMTLSAAGAFFLIAAVVLNIRRGSKRTVPYS